MVWGCYGWDIDHLSCMSVPQLREVRWCEALLVLIQPKLTYCCANQGKLDGVRHSNTRLIKAKSCAQ